MKLMSALIVSASLLITSYAFACPGKDKADAKTADVSITVDKAAKLHKKGKIVMVDANNQKTRQKEGFVPGARLLTSFKGFSESELKASKSDTLVFYCHSEACGAAPAAAKLARSKGYKAKVMPAGIMGWKKAGLKVAKL